ncbi:MAG: hypothetical protein EKK41_27625 [Hyphomicrobiales bacterium]|nr:MAG: hypothetical protein EKK41_27625 [Hyphomicrobiales bacterium]
MQRTKGHAWLLASAAVGAALCLEWLNLERTPVRAGAAVAVAAPAPEVRPVADVAPLAPPAAGASGKRKHTAAAASEPIVDPEPEQISARSEKAPPAPKLVSPPVEAKRPPKKSVVAASEPKRVVDTGPKPPAFVRSLLDGVNAVLGQP